MYTLLNGMCLSGTELKSGIKAFKKKNLLKRDNRINKSDFKTKAQKLNIKTKSQTKSKKIKELSI